MDATTPDDGGGRVIPDGYTPAVDGRVSMVDGDVPVADAEARPMDASGPADAGDPPTPAGDIAFEAGPYLSATVSADGYTYFTVQMADFTGDGHEDVLLTDHGGGTLNHYWAGDGAGNFTLQERDARGVGEELEGIRGALRTWVVDLDGDGDLDWGWDDNDVAASMRINDGTGSFTETRLSPRGARTRAFGDYDGDGMLDVVDAQGRVFDGHLILGGTIGDHDASPLAEVACDPVGLEGGEVVCPSAYAATSDEFQRTYFTRADFDGDGDDDAMVSIGEDFASDSIQRLYRNDGGTMVAVGVLPSSVIGGYLAYSNSLAADFDNDGDPDLALAGTASNTYTVFENAGSFAFVEAASFSDGCSSCKPWMSAGDYDEDGRIDVAVISDEGVQLYRNVSE